ncbi:MAG: AbrB/MazE/SpoVT family DNA-binding domain-containing protein [Solirubrobacteraceae bacterium]
MRTLRISRGGQVSVPAEVRHRWGTSTVEVEDRGDELVLRPAPDDPVAALHGLFAGRGGAISTEDARAALRADDAAADERRSGSA